MDHPAIAVASFLHPHARLNEYSRRHILMGYRYSSKIGGAPAGDMFVVACGKSSRHAVGEQIATLLIFVNKTFSEAGQVKLASADWRDEPTVDFNLLSDTRDLERLMEGFRQLAALHLDPALQAAVSNPFSASYSDKVRQVGVVNTKNKVMTDLVAKLLDGPAALRRLLIEKFIMEDFTLQQVLEDADALEALSARRRSASGTRPVPAGWAAMTIRWR